MHRSILTIALCLPVFAGAQATRTIRGDTTFVLTKGDGVWGPTLHATELVRIGGSGSRETTLGDPRYLTALPNGGVVFFDSKALDGPIVRLFDANGKFVRNIGRIGSGPGEYQSAIEISATADGRIMIADIGNARANLYSPEGAYLSQVRIPGESWILGMLQSGQGSEIYLARSTGSRGSDGRLQIGREYLRIDATGRVTDTLKPSAAFGPKFSFTAMGIAPNGTMAAYSPDTVSVFLRTAVGRRVIITTLDRPLAKYLPEEIASHQRILARGAQQVSAGGMQITMPPLAPAGEFKPPFQAIRADLDQRIWVRRNVPTIKGAAPGQLADPFVFDAFNGVDGTFLGEVGFPKLAPSLRISFAGNIAWTVVESGDELYVVKYRIR